jgi:hypothetical protein
MRRLSPAAFRARRRRAAFGARLNVEERSDNVVLDVVGLFLGGLLMKVSKHILCLLVMLLVGVLNVHAQETGQSPPPPKYRLELVYIFEATPTEYIFLVGNIGFKSVASLKKFLSDLPPGSILEWSPGCLRQGGEPLLSSAQDMEDFKAFCAEKEISFILVPAG